MPSFKLKRMRTVWFTKLNYPVQIAICRQTAGKQGRFKMRNSRCREKRAIQLSTEGMYTQGHCRDRRALHPSSTLCQLASWQTPRACLAVARLWRPIRVKIIPSFSKKDHSPTLGWRPSCTNKSPLQRFKQRLLCPRNSYDSHSISSSY